MSERAGIHRGGEVAASAAHSLQSTVTLLRLWGPATVTTLCLSFVALLYVSPDAPRAAVVASVIVLAFVAIASSYVRGSLTRLAAQVQREVVLQHNADRELQRLHAEVAAPTVVADPQLVRDIEAAVKGVITNLTLIAERAKAERSDHDDAKDVAAVDQAVARAASECNQLTIGFAAQLPSEHRHAFNNAVMPLSYSLDKAAKGLTRLLHRAPSFTADERVSAWVDGARAGAERIALLVRRSAARPIMAEVRRMA
jgi:ABC-type multidrug transport system fused ATPase/permease subunit